MINRMLLKLLAWFQRRCPHEPEHVTADILEGALPGTVVRWCRKCAAVSVECDPTTCKHEHPHSYDWRVVIP